MTRTSLRVIIICCPEIESKVDSCKISGGKHLLPMRKSSIFARVCYAGEVKFNMKCHNVKETWPKYFSIGFWFFESQEIIIILTEMRSSGELLVTVILY